MHHGNALGPQRQTEHPHPLAPPHTPKMLARLSQGRNSPGGARGLLLLPLLLGLMMTMMVMMEAVSVEEVESEESQEVLEEDEALSTEILVRTQLIRSMIY